MATQILYIACVLGAIGLYLIVRPGGAAGLRRRTLPAVGAILAIGAFAWLLVAVAGALGAPGGRPGVFFAVFTLIALGSAVRMITHSRPVYSALHFVLVVLASAGLFLLLEAEFMAFALIIVYAGAILITYMFVLMLAQQAPTPGAESAQPEYDLRPREPAAGAIVGFVLLALLSRMIFDGTGELPAPPAAGEVRTAAWRELEAMPLRIEEYAAREIEGPFTLAREPGAPILEVARDARTATVFVRRHGGAPEPVTLREDALPENVQRVGLSLIAVFPVSLELAGVILLMAMFGAVILARRQIELTEDEKREAAGMRRVGHHDDREAPAEGGGGT